MVYADAHIHIRQISQWACVEEDGIPSPVCTCAHSPKEWEEQQSFIKNYKMLNSLYNDKLIVSSFGIHPQNPQRSYIDYLENLLKYEKEDRPQCIGEAGFDLFTEDFARSVSEQTEVWNAELEFAINYNLPLVVHCRKALDKIFFDAKKLSKVPSVIFHSFSGSPQEAMSLLARNTKAHFSFGKSILNGNKRAIRCVTELPLDFLLAETDAPYQTLKDELVTEPSDIIRVYKKMAELRGISTQEVCHVLENNFFDSFL